MLHITNDKPKRDYSRPFVANNRYTGAPTVFRMKSSDLIPLNLVTATMVGPFKTTAGANLYAANPRFYDSAAHADRRAKVRATPPLPRVEQCNTDSYVNG